MAKSTIRGGNEVIRNLRKLARTPYRAVDKAGIESLEPMRELTEANARRLRQPGKRPRGGHLDQGVTVRKVDQRGQGYRVFWLSFMNRARKLAHLVEFGTAPHWQPIRNRMHPGARPKPFARPAFEQEKRNVAFNFGRVIWRAILAEARGMGRK